MEDHSSSGLSGCSQVPVIRGTDCKYRLPFFMHRSNVFMKIFVQIENHDNCVYDYIEIRDGPDENSALVTMTSIGTQSGWLL